MEEILLKFKSLSLEDMMKLKKEASKIIKERMASIDVIDILKQVETLGYVISIKDLPLDNKINLYFNVYVITVSDDINSVELIEDQPEWVNYFPVVLTDFINEYPDIDDVVQVDELSKDVKLSSSTPLPKTTQPPPSNPFVGTSKKIGKLPVYLYYKPAKMYPSKMSFKVITSIGEVRNYFIINSEVYTDQKQIFDNTRDSVRLNSIYILES